MLLIFTRNSALNASEDFFVSDYFYLLLHARLDIVDGLEIDLLFGLLEVVVFEEHLLDE